MNPTHPPLYQDQLPVENPGYSHIDEVLEHAQENDVRVLLYVNDLAFENRDIDTIFGKYQEWGVAGVKYGFLKASGIEKVRKTVAAIESAARHRLLINFHDNPVPPNGLQRTYPNLITVEFCHAQIDAVRAFTPTGFLRMVFVHMLTGPLDMNNGFFALETITERTNGGLDYSRRLPPINATVATEIARILITYTGLRVLPDAPEEYAEKDDLFEFVRKLPDGTWDETRVLHAEIGEYITTARRDGQQWFIGSVINETGGSLDIDLNFLDVGVTYAATLYEDTETSHYKNDRESYNMRQMTVHANDIITATMAPGGGHAVWLRPETPPIFTNAAVFGVAENEIAVGTVEATDSGSKYRITGYTITGGADQDLFEINSAGALSLKEAPDFEDPADSGSNNEYIVEVTATGGTETQEQTTTQTITVTVENADEPPGKPDLPTVSNETENSLTVSWDEPSNTGPPITDYNVQYREGSSGAFTAAAHDGTGRTTTIANLESDTSYEIQVQATSDEGTSQWSPSGNGRTGANQAPTFTDGSSTTRRLVENTTGAHNIGNPITASDGDGGTLTYHLEGTDRASFSLDVNQLQTQSGETYDYEEKSSYVVIVRVQDGQGGSNTIEVAINLIDRQEPPETPSAPRVIPASSTSLTVTWDEPTNTGPDIDDYDIQYREGDSGGFTSWTHNGPERAATITGRTPGTSFEVQVRARNDEGASLWSPSGRSCSEGGDAPTPVEVEVTAVPIVVASTTDEYFVLYVRHDLDGTEVEIPVLVKKGEAGTTTLAENVAALPKERYRVEKYLLADPADVDGDCIDDITELDDLGSLNPVNAAGSVDLNDGAVALPDRATFETLSYGFGARSYLKFVLLDFNTENPRVYFQNATTHPTHPGFTNTLYALGIEEDGADHVETGLITYHRDIRSANGGLGVYTFWTYDIKPVSHVDLIYTLLAASMPVLERDLA